MEIKNHNTEASVFVSDLYISIFLSNLYSIAVSESQDSCSICTVQVVGLDAANELLKGYPKEYFVKVYKATDLDPHFNTIRYELICICKPQDDLRSIIENPRELSPGF